MTKILSQIQRRVMKRKESLFHKWLWVKFEELESISFTLTHDYFNSILKISTIISLNDINLNLELVINCNKTLYKYIGNMILFDSNWFMIQYNSFKKFTLSYFKVISNIFIWLEIKQN